MKALVLGGTRFLGRHLVAALRAAGHEVTLLNRGRSAPALFAALEQIHGDRDPQRGDGLAQLGARRWDVVFDLCGYLPRVVQASCAALADRVGCYVFVSSVSAYAQFGAPSAPGAPGPDEDAPLAELTDPLTEDIAAHYGALKAACEAAVRQRFGARALVVRPGLIVGPWDPTGRFTYWPLRLARGGVVLAPAPAAAPLQFIDVRDLADWMLAAAVARRAGAFNLVGPVLAAGLEMTWSALLAACQEAAGSASEIRWIAPSALVDAGVAPWTELPLWMGPDAEAGQRVPNARARATGLRTRPLAETVRDTLAWALTPAGQAVSAQLQGIGLAPEREAALLQKWATTG